MRQYLEGSEKEINSPYSHPTVVLNKVFEASTSNMAFCLLTIFFPPLGLILGGIGLLKDFKNWKYYIFCLALAIASFAYCYVPTNNPDLYTYKLIFEQMACKPYRKSFESIIPKYDNLYVFNFLAWVFGRMNDYHFAAGFTTFIIYYIGFYITCDIGQNEQLSSKTVIEYIILISVSLHFTSVLGNIRNVFSLSLIDLAIYRDCYKHKRNIVTYLLYIIPIFIHTIVILIIVFRLLLNIKKIAKVAVSILAVSATTVLDFLYGNIGKFPRGNFLYNIIYEAINKGYHFFNETDSAWGNAVSNSGAYLLLKIAYVIIAIIFVISLNNSGFSRPIRNEIRKFDNYIHYVCLLTISCIPMRMPEYWRFASAFIIVGFPAYFGLTHKKNLFSNILIMITWACSLAAMLLWIREILQHCSLLDFFLKPLFSTPLFIIPRNIINMMFYSL